MVNSLGEATLRGRVEVCLDQQWTSVCDTSWTEQDATVVCKQLGYAQATNLGKNNIYQVIIEQFKVKGIE